MSRTRLVDVAAKAGVSRTTASAALSGTGRVSEATRRRVLEVADEMGYAVNRQAQNLRTQRAGAIGVYVPPDASGYEYYLDFAFGVVDRAMAYETPVVLIPHGSSEASLARDHVDGYIVIDAMDGDAQVGRILTTGKPVVAAEPLPAGCPDPAGSVWFDHPAGVRALLDHLAERGAARVAMISPPVDTSWARQVDQAYRHWCAEQGQEPQTVTAPFLAAAVGVEDPLRVLFDDGEAPDAVVVAQEGIVTGVSAALAARGLTIGSDVLLAACVDGVAVRSAVPPITAIDLRPREHGRVCADVLLSLLDGATVDGHSVRLVPTLQVRASTLG